MARSGHPIPVTVGTFEIAKSLKRLQSRRFSAHVPPNPRPQHGGEQERQTPDHICASFFLKTGTPKSDTHFNESSHYNVHICIYVYMYICGTRIRESLRSKSLETKGTLPCTPGLLGVRRASQRQLEPTFRQSGVINTGHRVFF